MNAINQADLRTRGADIFDAVENGESFAVTRRGKVIGKLVPIDPFELRLTPAKPFSEYISPNWTSERPTQEVISEMRGDR